MVATATACLSSRPIRHFNQEIENVCVVGHSLSTEVPTSPKKTFIGTRYWPSRMANLPLRSKTLALHVAAGAAVFAILFGHRDRRAVSRLGDLAVSIFLPTRLYRIEDQTSGIAFESIDWKIARKTAAEIDITRHRPITTSLGAHPAMSTAQAKSLRRAGKRRASRSASPQSCESGRAGIRPSVCRISWIWCSAPQGISWASNSQRT